MMRPAECLQHSDGPNHSGSRKDHVMAKKPLPSYEVVSQLLRYDRQTGKLFWLERNPENFTDGKLRTARDCVKWNAHFAGKEAFTSKTNGYLRGGIYGRIYKAHRVAWLLATGAWPDEQIDHINGIRTDNRFANLRQVSNAENCRNQRLREKNTSGVVGVRWNKHDRKWQAYIGVAMGKVHIGSFDEFDDAISARRLAEETYGFHPNHGGRPMAAQEGKDNG